MFKIIFLKDSETTDEDIICDECLYYFKFFYHQEWTPLSQEGDSLLGIADSDKVYYNLCLNQAPYSFQRLSYMDMFTFYLMKT